MDLWKKKLLVLLAGSIGWTSAELLMAWIFNVPVDTAIFVGFIARVSFGEVFGRNFAQKDEIGKRFRFHLGADLMLLPQSFLVLSPSTLSVAAALGGLLIGSYLVWKDEIDGHFEKDRLEVFLERYNSHDIRREQHVRTRVAELETKLKPDQYELANLRQELAEIEQKKTYRG